MSKLKPYIESIGQGTDLVLLHGWGLHSGIWELLADDLSSDFRLHLIDLPGFGRSPIPNDDYNLQLLTDQVLSVAPEKAHYLGWSLGGVIASQIAIQQPDQVDKLITVASNPKFVEADDWNSAMKANIMDSFCKFLEEDYQGTIIRFLAIQAIGSETQKEDIKRLRDTVFIHGMPATKALRGGLAMLNDIDLRGQLHKIQAPMLRLYGRLDSLVPNKTAEQVAQLIPHSQHKIYPKASHAPFLSHKEEFVQDIKQFLSE
ncbi:MAG: pimeloyl-ACP methyl ester esterase BioH [Kangiellaceae bacterium]|nr:pimeloyl-ACP methyl ester esterase BioH [Kangiellaceae bacterium]